MTEAFSVHTVVVADLYLEDTQFEIQLHYPK